MQDVFIVAEQKTCLKYFCQPWRSGVVFTILSISWKTLRKARHFGNSGYETAHPQPQKTEILSTNMEQGAFYKNFVQIRIQTQKFDYNDNTTGANPHKSAIFLASNHPLYYAILSEKNRISGVFRAFQQKKRTNDTANHT